MKRCVAVFDYPTETLEFVERGLWSGSRQFGPSTAIGFANEDEGLVAGVVYHDFDPDRGVIELSAYSSRRDWLTRSHLRQIFAFPFDQLQVRYAISRCSEKNTRVRRLWKALGAKEYILEGLWAEDTGMTILTLSRDTWVSSKFMKEYNGQARRSKAA